MSRLCSGRSAEDCPATIGAAHGSIRHGETVYEIWDVADEEEYRDLSARYLRGAAGVFLFVDVTAQGALADPLHLLRDIADACPNTSILLVGDKSHGVDEHKRSMVELCHFAMERCLDYRYTEVSVKTGEGVDEAFAQMRYRLSLKHPPRVDIADRFRHYRLLWRGSRDGFSARSFHRCCDGRRRTLTLIQDLDGNVFGGFAVPTWDSSFFWGTKPKTKEDPESGSFLFTLTNPHNSDPQIFKLIPGQEASAIKVSREFCVCFGNDELLISDGCNVNPSHSAGLGSTYQNTTGIDGRLVFSGSDKFTVKEIEVIGIENDLKTLPPDLVLAFS
jgi:hypothetical protein